jgi:hypothetical protein
VSAHATTVELAVQPPVDEIPERTARYAAIIDDAWLRIDKNHRWHDAALWASVRIQADDEIAAGLRATTALEELAPRLAAIEELHRPRRWGDSSVVICAHCNRNWDDGCDTVRLLNGLAVTS